MIMCINQTKKMKIKIAVIVLGIISLVFAAAAPVNFLFITADDMNWNSPGCYGNTINNITPNIDRLAAEGMRFEQAYITASICMPCRQSLMTGRYPHNNGAPGFNPIADSMRTLTEELHDAGYLTGIMGKEIHYKPDQKYPWDQVTRMVEDLGNGRDPEAFYKFSKQFFEKAKTQRKPFFLHANSSDPHRNFDVTGYFKPVNAKIPGFLWDVPPVRKEIENYYSSVHRCDATVQKVLQALEETGFKDNTMVTFLSDHGMAFIFAKSNVYMNSNRTCWIVRWPGVVEKGVVDTSHMISGLDYMPTIMEIAGLKPRVKMNGRSFLPVLKGERMGGFSRVFTDINNMVDGMPFPMRSVITKKYGYIYNKWSNGKNLLKNDGCTGPNISTMPYWTPLLEIAKKTPEIQARINFFWYRVPEEFYDYEKDPDALNNLINEPDYQPIILKMQQQMVNEMFMTGDSMLAPFQKLSGLTGKAVTRGCKDQNYEEYNKDATEDDCSYCLTLKNTQIKRFLPKATIYTTSFGGLVLKGFKPEESKLVLVNMLGRQHALRQTGAGMYAPEKKLLPGLYFINTKSRTFKVLINGD